MSLVVLTVLGTGPTHNHADGAIKHFKELKLGRRTMGIKEFDAALGN